MKAIGRLVRFVRNPMLALIGILGAVVGGGVSLYATFLQSLFYGIATALAGTLILGALGIARSRIPRIIRAFAVGGAVGGVIVLVQAATILIERPPTDAQMVSEFNQHRDDFGTLGALLQNDSTIEYLDQNDVDTSDSKPIPPAQVNQYRTTLRHLGWGYTLDTNGIDAWEEQIPFQCHFEKGYVWYSSPPTKGLMTKPLDDADGLDFDKYPVYRHINGPWYLYYDEEWNGM